MIAGVCRVCGCTDDFACPGGCAWVEDDLCTSCAPPADNYAWWESRVDLPEEPEPEPLLVDQYGRLLVER